MFTITWYNHHNRSWADDFIFRTMKEANDYLVKQGYSLNSGWYVREPIGWEGNTRAVISGVKIYGE